MAASDNKSSIQVIDRMMTLLDLLAGHTQPASLKLLAQQAALHPSSAHRILNVMVGKGLVDKLDSGAYRLGLKLLELGNLVHARLDIRREALPYMQALHQDIGETVNLSLRQGDEMVYVERTASGQSMMRVVQLIGTRAPLHITAVGKVFLADAGDEAALDYAKRTGLPAYTEHTITQPNALCEALAKIRKNGFAFDNEEAEIGVACIGAGIRDAEGKLIAGLSISAPVDRHDKTWPKKVNGAAAQISHALGYRAS